MIMGKEKLIMKHLKQGSICFGLLALIMVFVYFQQSVAASLDTNKINLEKSITQNFTAEKALNNNLEKQNINQKNVLNNNLEEENFEVDLSENKANAEEEEAAAGNGSKARTFRSTAYCLRGRTASGRMVRRGIVAADPRVLPLGTRIKLSAGKYSGTYIVADTGGKIKGNILDIWVPSCAEARRWGRRTVKVTVLSKGKKRSKKRRSRKGE